MSMIRTKREAVELAKSYLSDFKVGRRKIELGVSVDRREKEYWYILVKPKQSISDTIRYYDELGKIESRIYRETGEGLLFVPVLV